MSYAVTAQCRRVIKNAKAVAAQAAAPFAYKYSVFDQQDVFPDAFARSMTYEYGWAFGFSCYSGDAHYRGFLGDARVLVQRHGSVAAAAQLMCVSEAGLRGFLDGAAGAPPPASLLTDEPSPAH